MLCLPEQDKRDPKAWVRPDNITLCPPEEVMGGTALDQLSKLFNQDSISQMFSGSSSPASS